MNKLALIGIFSLIAASASASAQTNAYSTAPSAAPHAAPMAQIAAAHSMTEEQAKSHIEKMGFTDVTGLKMDDKGMWHGHAMKGGKKMPVSVDHKGDVHAK